MMKVQIQSLSAAILVLAGYSHAADDKAVDVSGTFSQGYIYSQNNNFIDDSTDGTFHFREYGGSVIWRAYEKVQIGAQVFGREYGVVGNDDVYLDWAYLDYRPADAFGVRLGKQKVPSGLYNETREIDALRTEILLPGAVYPELTRELVRSIIGVGLYGDLNTAKAGTFSYLFQVGERQLDEDNGDLARILQALYYDVDDYDLGPSYAAKLGWITPVNGLEFGATYSYGEVGIDGQLDYGRAQAMAAGQDYETAGMSSAFTPIAIDFDGLEYWVLSAEYTRGELTLVTEWTRVISEAHVVAPEFGLDSTSDGEQEGAYVKAGYRWTEWLDTAIGYATSDNRKASEGKGDGQDDYFISLRFDITENVILKLEEHFISGTQGLLGFENPDGMTEDMTVFLAKATLYF